jgi:choline dehydrogenase-like flavoprotein
MAERFDYIVVGGGSSGCVAAAKLVQESGARVLLLEAGHSHRHPLLDMPPGIFKMINGSKFMRYHQTVPQEHLDGRVHDIPQANVLGGGSSVNAQVYMRGRPSDYDEWHELLRGENDYPGWGWKHVLPHFRGMEGNNRLHDERHGANGPLLVSDPGHINDLSRWFVQAMQALGEPYNHDFNGPNQRGVGFYQFMNRMGKRSSAAYAFIAPLEGDPRLTIRLNARVRRIDIEHGRAVGVTWRDAKGRGPRAAADGEVDRGGGSLVTPQLLMLSGIGAAEQLREHGIPCLVDLPGVGENLIDHPGGADHRAGQWQARLLRQGVGWRMLLNGLHFKLFGSGPILSAGVEAGAFVNPRTRRGADDPGLLRAHRLSRPRHADAGEGHLRADGDDRGGEAEVARACAAALGGSGRDAAGLAQPAAAPDDARAMIDGQRFFLRAFQTSPLRERVQSIAIPILTTGRRGDHAHCRRFVKTNYHPAGTCRMGPCGRSPVRAGLAHARSRGGEAAGLRSLRHARHQRRQYECPRHDDGKSLRGVRGRRRGGGPSRPTIGGPARSG